MSSSSRNKEQGFTLIEVLISMAIMMMISFGIYQAWSTSFRLVGSLQAEGDFYNNIRLSMSVVERDVALIYDPTIMLPPQTAPSSVPGQPPGQPPGAPAALTRDQQALQSLLQTELGQTTDFWGPAADSTGIRPSRFIGTENRMSFVATSHLRVYRDSPESEFARIVYEVQKEESGDAMTLFKRENTNAFESDDRREKQVVRSYPLLHGIKKIRFRYFDKEKERGTWLNSWDSQAEGTKGAYPDIVEIELSVDGPERMSFEGKYRFRPEVPLRGLDPST